MNARSESMIRNRLNDKVVEDFSLLLPYLSEDDLAEIATKAFTQTEFRHDHELAIAAHDRIEDIKHQALEGYYGDNEAAEYLEWVNEMREAEDDAKREEQWVGYESARAA